jgi:integrase
MASIRARSGSFEVRANHQGRVFSKTFKSEADARRWAAGVEHGFIDVSVKSNPKPAYPPLTEAIERYASEVSCKHRGARQELVRLKQLGRQPWASLSLDAITPAQLKAMRDSMLAKGSSPSTVRLMLVLVSAMFRHARREWGMKVDNPISEIKLPPPSPARYRRLSRDEETRLLRALSRCRRPGMTELVVVALETGMRRSELLNLPWEHVDLKARLLTLPTTKNGQPRWVPLTETALSVFEALRATNRCKPFELTERQLEEAWKNAIKRAEILDLRFHDLRHEALSRWAHRLGGDVFKLSLVSGHKTLQMARRYVHPVESELLAALSNA